MAKPKVRDLGKLIASQQKSLQPQYDLIDSDIGLIEQSGEAQVAGLDARKDAAFGQIEQGAEDKGMFFSGFSPNEQAGYVGSTYLPALAEMQATIARGRNALLGEKAGLGKSAFDTAVGLQESDRDRRFTYDERIAGQKFTATQAAKDREFKATESAKDRAAAAANAARSSSGASASDVMSADVRGTVAALGKKTGGDGYVSPSSYAKAKSSWKALGYEGGSFDSKFASFRNPKNKYYRLGK